MNQTELTAKAEALLDQLPEPDQRIDQPKYSRVSREKESAILKLSALGKTQTEIAQVVGVSQPTVSRVLSEFTDTREHARAALNRAALPLAERVVKQANVAEALDVLERIDVVRPKRQDAGTRGPQVIVMMPGQTQYVPDTIDLSPPDFRLDPDQNRDAK